MTARDPDLLIRTFLSEGRTDLPDRAFDEVRRDIHRTRQRVAIGPWREPDMPILARVAIAAVAVVAIGLAWINLGPSQRVGVGTQPTPSVTAAPTPSPSPRPLPYGGVLEPGRYAIPAVGGTAQASYPRLALTLPTGWTAQQGSIVDKNYGPTDVDAGASFVVWQISGTFVHPCTDHTLVTPTPGPGIDALITALAHQPGTRAGPPTAVTVDGYTGKYVEVAVTDDVPTCGLDQFWLWASPDGDRRYVQGTNETNRIFVIQVDGQRFTFNARIPARTTAADRAELEAVLESIEIEPAG